MCLRLRVTAFRQRFATALICAAAGLCMIGAVPAHASDYAYWYALPGLKVMRESRPPPPLRTASTVPTGPALYLTAAQAEHEGRQIAIRPATTVTDLVITPSDLVQNMGQDESGTPAVIRAENVEVFWVKYVRLTRASYGLRTRVPSWWPDALPPTKLLDGTVIPRTLPASVTQPFYVLFHVPDGTPKGTYTGALTLGSSNTPTVTVPVTLRVWGFSVAKQTLRTSFGFSIRTAKYFANSDHYWPRPWQYPQYESTDFGGDSLNRWMRFFADHRISPQTLLPGFSTPNSSGSLLVRQQYVDDYAGSQAASTFSGQQLNFNTLPMPDRSFFGTYVSNPFSSYSARVKAINYYYSMRNAYGANMSRALVYSLDEPYGRDRALVEKHGWFVRRYLPGTKYMVTIDPSRFSFRPFRYVDAYVHKLHFYWRDYRRWIAPLRRRGKRIWIYSHTTAHQKVAPLYLIDKATTESEVQGWFAYAARADGILHFSVNRWVSPYDKTKFRDPYLSPLSVYMRCRNYVEYSNGDGSLLYPGYYPALGLSIPGAAPVSSLRMEALRDGLEDFEYLKLLERKKGRTYAMRFVYRVVNMRRFAGGLPVYSRSPYTIRAAREAVAREIEAP